MGDNNPFVLVKFVYENLSRFFIALRYEANSSLNHGIGVYNRNDDIITINRPPPTNDDDAFVVVYNNPPPPPGPGAGANRIRIIPLSLGQDNGPPLRANADNNDNNPPSFRQDNGPQLRADADNNNPLSIEQVPDEAEEAKFMAALAHGVTAEWLTTDKAFEFYKNLWDKAKSFESNGGRRRSSTKKRASRRKPRSTKKRATRRYRRRRA